MNQAHPRLVVSGPVGSGKTTLVNALAARLGVPALAEHVAPLVKAESAFRRARRATGATAAGLEPAMRACIEAYRQCLAKRAQQYAMPGGFVADRWEGDLLDYWLVMLAPYAKDALTHVFLDDLQSKAKNLTALVMLPLERPDAPVEQVNEQQLRRNLRYSASLLNWTVSCGLARQFTSMPLIVVPNAARSVEERVNAVVAQLADGRNDA